MYVLVSAGKETNTQSSNGSSNQDLSELAENLQTVTKPWTDRNMDTVSEIN